MAYSNLPEVNIFGKKKVFLLNGELRCREESEKLHDSSSRWSRSKSESDILPLVVEQIHKEEPVFFLL